MLGLVLIQALPGNLDPGREPDLAESLGVLEELLERLGVKAVAKEGCAPSEKSRTFIPALTRSAFWYGVKEEKEYEKGIARLEAMASTQF